MRINFGRTFGAAIGAAIVIMFMATIATRMAHASAPQQTVVVQGR